MVAMPLSGYLMSVAGGHTPKFFGLFKWPTLFGKSKPVGEFFHATHGIIAMIILLLVILHVGFGLKRHFGAKDKFLNRMLPFKNQ